jgi:hypothetical protein
MADLRSLKQDGLFMPAFVWSSKTEAGTILRLGIRCSGVQVSVSPTPAVTRFSLNTSPLIGHATAPFLVNFQFKDGLGTGDTNNLFC